MHDKNEWTEQSCLIIEIYPMHGNETLWPDEMVIRYAHMQSEVHM